MAHFRSSRFCTFAIAALMAVASTVVVAFDRAATACTAVYQLASDFVASVPAKFAEPVLRLTARPVELVQACAYALGLAKRERPHVRSQWRMCPSRPAAGGARWSAQAAFLMVKVKA
jgi:hypothetical protein